MTVTLPVTLWHPHATSTEEIVPDYCHDWAVYQGYAGLIRTYPLPDLGAMNMSLH